MRTLKKTLALVLCLAMIAGLCCFGTSAAFADAAEIEQTEAATVMNTLGVLKGDGTNFNPKGILTRAEAAVMLAKLIGEGNIKATSSYKDMKGYEWAQSYAALCEAKGFIKGDGAGNFLPGATLTGYQFGLMLCRALGYNPSAEGVESATYEIGTAALMKKIGLDKAVANFDGTAGLTRENAAAMLLKALQTTMVEYSNAGTTITGGGFTITTGASAAAKVEDAGAQYDNISNTTNGKQGGEAAYYVELGEKYFPLLVKESAPADLLGRPANTWTYNGKPVGTFTTATPAFTFKTAMIEKVLFAAVGDAGIQGQSDKYIVLDSVCTNGNLDTNAVNIEKNATDLVSFSGNGTTIELYAVPLTPNHYTAVVYNEYIGVVSTTTSANELTGAKRYVTLDSGETFETEDFVAGDVVLYTKNTYTNPDTVVSMKKADTITGKVTKSTSAGVYTIGDVETKISASNESVSLTVGVSEGTWYVDSCGNVIAPKSVVTTAWKYGYLVNYAAQDKATANLMGIGAKETAEKFQIVTAEGKLEVLEGVLTLNALTGAVATNGWVIDSTSPYVKDGSNVAVGKLVRYTTNAEGKILALEFVTDANANTDTGVVEDGASEALSAAKGTATMGGKYITDSTVFIVIEDVATGKYATYTGYNNIPLTLTSTLTGNCDYEYFYTVSPIDGTPISNTIAAVMIKGTAAAQTAPDYVWFASLDCTTETTVAGTVTTYTNVYLNGVKGEIKFLGTVPANIAQYGAAVLHKYTLNATTGYATLAGGNYGMFNTTSTVSKIESGYYVTSHQNYPTIYTSAATEYFQIDYTTKAVTKVASMPALNPAYTIHQVMATANGQRPVASTTPATAVYFYVAAN